MVKSSSRRQQTDTGTSRSISLAKAPHFFKIITYSSAVRHSKLMIPRNFVSKYGKNLSNLVLLKVPSGAVWKVELVKSNGDIWLCNGWREFREYYSLKFGHFLVFRYDGDSCFHVLIFDMSATEVEYPFRSTHTGQTSMNLLEDSLVAKAEDINEADDSVEILEDFPCEMDNNTGSLQEIVAEDNGLKLTNPSDVKPFCLTGETKKECIRGTSAALRSRKSEIRNTKQSAEASGEFRALQRARAFKSKNPFFTVSMQRSYVASTCALNIPVGFARKYLSGKMNKITLQVSDGRTWSVRCYCMKSSPKRRLCWISFVRDNNLELGDVCVFVLIKEGFEPLLNVTIFRSSVE